jgi:hypothetical protein
VANSVRYIYLDGKVIAEVDATATGGVVPAHGRLRCPVARTDPTGALISRTRYKRYGATAAVANPGTASDNTMRFRIGTQSPGNTPATTVHTGSNGVTVVTGNGGRVVTVIPR